MAHEVNEAGVREVIGSSIAVLKALTEGERKRALHLLQCWIDLESEGIEVNLTNPQKTP